MSRILIIEDEESIANLEKDYLELSGFEVEIENDGESGLFRALKEEYDLFILDLMLPGLPGGELIGEIRRASRVPVIVLSARAELSDKVALLTSGADDYLTKPYALEELWARVQVQLRHASAAPVRERLRFRAWELDQEEMTLTAAGQPVSLTAHEYKIVALLAGRPKRVFTKQQIYEAVWQEECAVEDKTISVHISNIRAKLRPSGTDGYIQTVWGIGFRLAEG